jgi:1-aminocyclopropane-1-carboxylate deaminase
MNTLPPTPLSSILFHPGSSHGIRLWIKRDDLNHPLIQGNKWRKLQPVLQQLKDDGASGVVSFGGPFSNHLHALAAAGQQFGLHTVGIVRGEHIDLNNPTMQDVRNWGMTIFPVSKSSFNLGRESTSIAAIIDRFPGYYVLPEGGSTPLGVRSSSRIALEILTDLGQDALAGPLFLAVPAGTGCTAAGVVAGASGYGQVLIFPAAPYGTDRQTIDRYLQLSGYPNHSNFTFITDYIFGRFASRSAILHAFVQKFETDAGILLDPIYTAKMMYGLYDLLAQGYFPPHSTVVAIHTGGLQGRRGFPDP